MAGSKTAPGPGERRRFLAQALQGMGACLSLALLPGHEARAAPRLAHNPFTLGVASGDPTPDGIVLWTRLASEPADNRGMGRQPLPVLWRVASNPSMSQVVASGVALAWDALAHSVHVELDGLLPGRDHWYQFSVGGEESPVGHFRTAPAAHEMPKQLKFAVASCQDWRRGHFTAYRDMLDRDLDLLLHLGDYTYEKRIEKVYREGVGVPHGFDAETVDLETYRLRHALYKLDPDLQAAHAAFPFAVVWDDHELVNDYAGRMAGLGKRRAAAYQAYYEHMPIRLRTSRWPITSLRIYRNLQFGRLAQINLLDVRQYRSVAPCGAEESVRCAAAAQDSPTMLGTVQERWLAGRLRRRDARWNLIAQQVMVAQCEQPAAAPGTYRNDTWDGYPQARRRLLDDIVDSGASNPVVLTGDWHSTFVNDLKVDFAQERAPSIAAEFVTPSLCSGGDTSRYSEEWGPAIPHNPHIKFYDGDRRGYFVATLRAEELRMDLRLMTGVQSRRGRAYAGGSWVVPDGVPWATAA